MKLNEVVEKETRTAKEMINNPETDKMLKSLLIKAVARDGENIEPAGPNKWEQSMNDMLKDGNFRLWYNLPDGNTHTVTKND
jgi:hypothetical protein